MTKIHTMLTSVLY